VIYKSITMSTRKAFEKNQRPITTQVLCHQMSTWLALKCKPFAFDDELVRSMLGTYYKLTKKMNKPKEDALSNKQYDIMYNLWDKYNVQSCFQFADLKCLCVDVSLMELDVKSASGTVCKDFYFETKNDGVLTVDEFVDKYKLLIFKYNMVLTPSTDDDFC